MSNCNEFEFTSSQGTFYMDGGIRGKDGVTFYPHVSAAGILSWTNDGGKTNPDPVDIKGEDGMSAFYIAEYEETTYDEIQTAISEGKYVCAGRSGFPESYIYYSLAGGAQGSDVWGDYNALVFARFDIDALNNKKLYKLTCKKYTLSGSTQWESETLPVELADDVLEPVEADIDSLKSTVKKKAPAIYDTASGAIASFEDGADGMPLKSLTVNIEPVQSGTGDPSPDNVRPITGWTGCNIVVSPTTDEQDGTTYPITFPTEAGTVYGGTLTVNDDGSGVLSVENFLITMTGIDSTSEKNDGRSFSGKAGATQYHQYYTQLDANDSKNIEYVDLTTDMFRVIKCSHCPVTEFDVDQTLDAINIAGLAFTWLKTAYGSAPSKRLQTRLAFSQSSGIDTVSKANKWLADQYSAGTPVTYTVPLRTPYTYTLTAPQVRTLLGTNNIWADCGDVTVEYLADTFTAISSNINLAIDSTHNFIDYGYSQRYYDQKDNSATNSLVLGIERVNQVVTLNKDKQSSGAIRVRLNGSVAKTITSSTVANWLDDLVYFKGGARYKVTTKYLSGEISSGGVSVSIYKAGTSTSIGYSRGELYLNGYAERFFVAEENVGYNIALYLSADIKLINYKVIITIEEIESTEQQYSSEMDTTINSVIGLMTEPCLIFPMLTDIHYMSPRNNINPSQFVRTADNINYFMDKVACDGLICLGDITDGGYSSLPNSVENGIPMISDIFSELMESGKPLYFAVGNHDDFRYVSKYMQPHEIYNYYMRHSDTDVIYDEQSYGTNYYKDFPGMKTRLICFNTNILPTSEAKGEYGISGRTLTWVTNVLTDMPNDYIGMMITHVSINNGITSVEYPYNVSNGANLRSAIRNSGKLCFVMCGHSHFDIAYKGENDPLIILQGCAKCEGETTVEVTTVDNISGGIRYGRSVDDETADLWDVVVLRPFSKKLDLVRFGAGVDRSFDLTL